MTHIVALTVLTTRPRPSDWYLHSRCASALTIAIRAEVAEDGPGQMQPHPDQHLGRSSTYPILLAFRTSSKELPVATAGVGSRFPAVLNKPTDDRSTDADPRIARCRASD